MTPGRVLFALGLLIGVHVVGWGARQLGAPRRDLVTWYEIGAGCALVALYVGPGWYLLGTGALTAGVLAFDWRDRCRSRRADADAE